LTHALIRSASTPFASRRAASHSGVGCAPADSDHERTSSYGRPPRTEALGNQP